MTPQQMQDKIENLEARVELLEKEIGRLTDRLAPPVTHELPGGGTVIHHQYPRTTDGRPERASDIVDTPFQFPRYTAGG